jgi:hypothetical protein
LSTLYSRIITGLALPKIPVNSVLIEIKKNNQTITNKDSQKNNHGLA